MNDKTVLYVHETVLQSWARDIGSIICCGFLMGVGSILGNIPMQWFGFFLAAIIIIGVSVSRDHKVSPQRAADILYEKFGVRAR